MNDRLRTKPDFASSDTGRKIYVRSTIAWSAGRPSPEQTHARAEMWIGKNFIGLLHEETGEQRATAEMQTSTGRRIGQYVLGLMAAMFNRRSETKV